MISQCTSRHTSSVLYDSVLLVTVFMKCSPPSLQNSSVANHEMAMLSLLINFYCVHTYTYGARVTFSYFICAGVGTRNYYRKIGYELDGPYMSKLLYNK